MVLLDICVRGFSSDDDYWQKMTEENDDAVEHAEEEWPMRMQYL